MSITKSRDSAMSQAGPRLWHLSGLNQPVHERIGERSMSVDNLAGGHAPRYPQLNPTPRRCRQDAWGAQTRSNTTDSNTTNLKHLTIHRTGGSPESDVEEALRIAELG